MNPESMNEETGTTLAFTKMHGAGNDYVYVDGRGPNARLDWPSLTVAIGDRHFGVGSDGVILALESETADLRMKMFNADGSEGKMCGNGIRCLTAFAVDLGIVAADQTPISVETASGVLSVTPIWRDGRMVRARVDMGEPQFSASEVPFNVPGQPKLDDYPLAVGGSNFAVTGVSMGNPHAVAVVDQPVADIDLARLGPLVEHDARFPEGVNFGIVNVVSPNEVNLRVWERGSGLTMACGTGACAAVVATHLKGLTGDAVTVNLPGGQLDIEWSGRGSVIMEGAIEKVFEGEWPL